MAISILDQLHKRLREARIKLGLNQAEIATAGGVSRSAQVRYESSETAPSTDYLRGIQSTGIDISYVLFGLTSDAFAELAAKSNPPPPIDWSMIKQAFEDVEVFCEQNSPKCPMSHRWEIVAEIYALHNSAHTSPLPMDRHSRQQVIKDLWIGK
jgi:transcriptional regulator with XRE-family HTH domain